MAALPIRIEAHMRGVRMLRTAMGASIAAWLADPEIIEIMLNPDGRLWVDRLGDGVSDTGEQLNPADGERIIRLVAHHVSVEVHADAPRVSAELPEGGERFEGLLPPVVAAPTFAIRKPAVAIFTLGAYIETFNGSLRDECLNLHWFASISEARRLIEAWRIDYNVSRPHMALGNLTPAEYLAGPETWRGRPSRKLTLGPDHHFQALQRLWAQRVRTVFMSPRIWFDIWIRIFRSWRRAVISVLINMLSKPLTRTSQ